MRKNLIKSFIYLSLLLLISPNAYAESLFSGGVSQSVYPMNPKSLFGTVAAKTIGDVITVIVNENATVEDDLKLNLNNSSNLTDKFSNTIHDIVNEKYNLPDVDDFGGESQTNNTASSQRTMKLNDTITAQVVQVLPNGNLVIQGKKMAINAGETTQVILSGIVDPRFVTNAGTIHSNNIANLQLAVTGSGTISRRDSESLINRIFGYLF